LKLRRRLATLAAVNPPFDADLIRHALARVRQSREFRRSPGLQSFLTFLVDAVLAGRTDELKESFIKVELFRPTPACDSKADPIVRVGYYFRAELLRPSLPAE
jgi:hypothetical protein